MKFSLLYKLKILDIIRYNVFGDFAALRPVKGTTFCLEKGAKIIGPGKWNINSNQKKINGAISVIKMAENATIWVNGIIHQNYGADITVEKDAQLYLGDCIINSYVDIYCATRIEIGNGVLIGQHVTIRDDDGHRITYNGKKDNEPMSKPVIIKDNVWIAINATIMKGVTIGEGSVVAAGALVTKDVPPHCLVAGVPARVIKEDITWVQ